MPLCTARFRFVSEYVRISARFCFHDGVRYIFQPTTIRSNVYYSVVLNIHCDILYYYLPLLVVVAVVGPLFNQFKFKWYLTNWEAVDQSLWKISNIVFAAIATSRTWKWWNNVAYLLRDFIAIQLVSIADYYRHFSPIALRSNHDTMWSNQNRMDALFFVIWIFFYWFNHKLGIVCTLNITTILICFNDLLCG